MKFVSAIWKLLVGIKDALVLIAMLLFFGFLYGALSARPAPVGEGVLALRLDGSVVEQPQRASLADVVAGGSGMNEYALRDLVGALEVARTDKKVKAVALDLERFTGGGQTALADLADAIRGVRAAGKPVVAYAVGYSDDSYLLASAASEVWLNPLGAVALAGPGGPNLYFKGLLDKLGVTANVYRVGTYKAAVEPFTRNDASPEAKQNAQALSDALLETWRETVSKNRPKARVNDFMMNPVGALQASGGDFGRAAIGFGLVDKLGDREEFERHLAKLADEDEADYEPIKLSAYINDRLDRDGSGSIGVVTVAGMIVDGKASAGTAGGDSIAKLINDAVDEDGLKALVVRVDSPGGSVLASERIRQAILNAKAADIPVVVSMGNVAASGGYWIATPADFIFAEPSTVTGSIGVFGVLPSFQGSLEKLGIGADGVKTTPLSGEPDLLRGPSPEVNQLLQAGVNSTYARFVQIVAQSRKKTPAEIDRVAQGRVWDGGTARQLGLVDGFGSLDEAVAKAGELAKIDDPQDEVRHLEAGETFEEQIAEMLANERDDDDATSQDAFATLAPQAMLAAAIADARTILSGPSIQVRCLECPVSVQARPKREDVGFFEALLRFFA